MGLESLTESQLVAYGYFEKLPDGRWAVDPKHPECGCVEGPAAIQDPAISKAKAIGNCQLCSNWNPRVGCVLGSNLALSESRCNQSPMQFVTEQAHAWVEIGRFDRAISRLETYLKAHSDSPDAYLALAKVYDHPGYHGKDKRRAIVLYGRYMELRGKNAQYHPEFKRAAVRVQVLSRQAVPSSAAAEEAPPLATFNCFHRSGGLTHFYACALTYDVLVMAYVGDADPDSGISSLEVGETFEKATFLWRKLMGEKDLKQEIALTAKEIEHVSGLNPVAMAKDHRSNLWIHLNSVKKTAVEDDAKRGIRRVTIWSGTSAYELLFPMAQANRADHVTALVRFLSSEASLSSVTHPKTKSSSVGA
ncbi:MAG: tetratricopeptide repeat protein [Planctomycetes bacterium]|nr:tetratricopeptide repeat protein [Planctomycetota bacterium]